MNGQRLKSLRKEHKLSQKELGLKLNLAESTISLYESGKRTPDNETLTNIAKFFNVSTDYLLDIDINKSNVVEKNYDNFENQLKELIQDKNGIYFRLAKEAKELNLDEDDVNTILKIYSKHRERNSWDDEEVSVC